MIRRALITALAVASAHPGLADPASPSASAPLSVQAAIFKKVVGYDRALEGKASLRVLVFHAPESASRATEVVTAFDEVGFSAEACEEPAGLDRLDDRAIIYLLTAPSAAIQEAIAKAGALTLTGEPELIGHKYASVGLRPKADGKTEIVIDLSRARAERHDFTSYLLAISTILK